MTSSEEKKRTKILHCSCNHVYQDSVYGNSMRLHNLSIAIKDKDLWRCTVCGSVK